MREWVVWVRVCVCDSRSLILLSIYRLCKKQTESVLAFIWRCSDSMIKIFIAIKQICFVRFIDFTHYCSTFWLQNRRKWVSESERNKKIGTCIYLLLFYSGRSVESLLQFGPSLAHIHTHESQERPRKMRKLNGFCCATNYTKSQACIVIWCFSVVLFGFWQPERANVFKLDKTRALIESNPMY